MSGVELQPLRIPSGWTVRWNELRAVDPQTLSTGDPDWELLGEDLLQIEQDASGLLLDAGWYPEASPGGRYRMVLIRGTDWGAPLARFDTRSPAELVERIEETLSNPPDVEPLARRAEEGSDDLAKVLEHDPDVHESVRAAGLLAERDGAAAVPVLIARLADPRPFVRYAVVDALRRIGDPTAGAALLERFLRPETDLDTRRLLLRALGAVKHEAAIPILTTYLQNPDAHQRAAAASALAALGATDALPAVEQAYANERDGPVRAEIGSALSRLARTRGATE